MNKFYERHIHGGQSVTIVAVLLFIAVRLISIFLGETSEYVSESGGILWGMLKEFIPSSEMSILLAGIFGVVIAILLSWINNKFALIRTRTYLPIAFVLLLLSISPYLIFLSPHYIAVLFLLLAIEALFSSYQSPNAQRNGIAVGMYLAIASLFVTEYLIFLPLFLIGFSMMRCFSQKVFWATLLPFVLTYALVYSYLIFVNQTDLVQHTFNFEIQEVIHLLSFETILPYVVAILAFIILCILVIDNRMNSFKDKIRVRESVLFIYMLLIISFLGYYLSPILSLSEALLMPLFIEISFILARFWETSSGKWKIYSFFIFMGGYFYFVGHNILTYFS